MEYQQAKQFLAAHTQAVEAILTLSHAESYLWSLIPRSSFPVEHPELNAAIQILQDTRRIVAREARAMLAVQS